MQQKKYGVLSAVCLCFRYSPGAASAKLLLEIAGGALAPLMVLVVAAFVNGALALAQGDGQVLPLAGSLALMAAGYAFGQVSQVIVRRADAALENALRAHLRPQLVRHQACIRYALLEEPQTQDLVTHVCDNAEKQIRAILGDGIRLVGLAVGLFGTLSLLAASLWWMLPLFLLSMAPITWLAHRGGRAVYAIERDSVKLTRKHYYLSSVLVGRETAAERTLFGYGDGINGRFSAVHLKRSNLVTQAIAIEETTIHGCGLLLNVLVLAAVFALLPAVRSGQLSHGLYVSLIGALIGMVRTVAGTYAALVRDASGHGAFMRDFTRFFTLPQEETALQEGRAHGVGFARLQIRDLRFRYTPQGEYVLKGVTLTMERGKTYSLIGQNGAGKSTLTKILLGLYRDFEGEILIDGVDIARFTPAQLRSLFGVVYQDFARYAISLRDNIALGGIPGDLDRAAELAGLGEVIAGLPQGLDTPLGTVWPGGADLSGGQWQRVAIARALAADAPVLILDEPTASLSPMAESRLYRRFAQITQGRTSLLISHRLGSTKLSDVLFVLDDGVIAETGSHKELLAAKGIYAGMFANQRSWYDGQE